MLLILCTLFALDIPVVKNQTYPNTGEVMVFTEDLRFGSDESDEHFLWPNPDTNLTVDQVGHIFVADVDGARILEFDQNGTFLRTIATKGEGPGELFSLESFHILSDGRAVAYEALRMRPPATHNFDKSLAFTTRFLPAGPIKFVTHTTPSLDGGLLIASWLDFDMAKGKQSRYVGLVDRNFQLIKQLSSETQGMQMARLLEPAYLTEFLAESLAKEFVPRGFGNFDPSGRCYTALTTNYEVQIWNPGGENVERRVQRECKPRVTTEAQNRALLDRIADRYRGVGRMGDLLTENFLERVLATAELPPAAKRIHGVVPTEDGHFLVIEHVDFANGHQKADLYSPQGKLLGKVERDRWSFLSPNTSPRMLFRNGFAYTVETDEEGDTRVLRFRYKITKK